MKNTWFDGERPTDSGGTVYAKPEGEEPRRAGEDMTVAEAVELIRLTGPVMQAWRARLAFGVNAVRHVAPELAAPLDELERIWPS